MPDSKSLTFLFWNIDENHVTNRIVRIVRHYHVDIMILAECKIKESEILLKLNEKKTEFFFNNSRIPGHKIRIFSKFHDRYFHPVQESGNRLTIRKLILSANFVILVAALHLISKEHFDEKSQYSEASKYCQEIINAEKNMGNKNTIMIGDFNINPFEYGMIAGDGFNSVMSRKIAKRGKRKVQGKDYEYFYNPMWNFFGDLKDKPPGTYYYESSSHENYHWNIFDQVLVRPSIIELMDYSSLEILDGDGIYSLLKDDGVPDRKNASDHLPILFSLKI